MRTSCGRSDGEQTNQATEIPRAGDFLCRLSPPADHYNRLESGRRFRFLYAANRSSIYLLSTAAKPTRGAVSGALYEISAPQPFLSFPQGRESCRQQIWRVTPFRRGIA